MSSTNAPSQNNQQQEQPKTYKEQLDEAAIDAKASEGNDANQGGLVNTVVEKVTQYVPAIGKVLGQGQDSSAPENETKVPGPPERPHHDTQIEEFVRDQHRSRTEDGNIADA